MKVIFKHIVLLSFIFILFGCKNEEDLIPVASQTYIKILDGNGADDPVAVRALADGNLLIVANSVSFEEGEQIRKIRLLKLNLEGKIMDEQYLPESTESWSARDVLKIQNNEIVLAATIQNSIGADSSLLFYKINEKLEFIASNTYQNDAEYTFFGIVETENELIFTAEEDKDSDTYPILGGLNPDNLEITDIKQAVRYDVPPATKAYRNESGEYIWVYNRSRSYLTRVQADLLQVNEQEILIADGGIVKGEKLFMEGNNPTVFGEVERGGLTEIFYYEQSSGRAIVFGSSTNTFLNNVQSTEDGYLVTGYQDLQIEGSESRQSNFFLSRRSENGGETFSKTFGSNQNEELSDAIMINNGIYSIGKTVFGGENTLLLIKTDAFGQLKN